MRAARRLTRTAGVALAFACSGSTLGFGAAGCGGGGARAPSPARAARDGSMGSAASDAGIADAASATPPWPALEELAARAPSVAAGMREEKRQEIDAAGAVTLEITKATSADACARVSLAATRSVHAWLEDARGNMLADAPLSPRVVLAVRGPVCVRKGDAVVLRVEAAEAFRVRVVAWASP